MASLYRRQLEAVSLTANFKQPKALWHSATTEDESFVRLGTFEMDAAETGDANRHYSAASFLRYVRDNHRCYLTENGVEGAGYMFCDTGCVLWPAKDLALAGPNEYYLPGPTLGELLPTDGAENFCG